MANLAFDGASRGNPGRAAYGYVLTTDDETIEGYEPIGTATNNEAEYQGLKAGLEEAAAHGVENIKIEGDSELIVKQLKGAYDVNAANLKPLHDAVRKVLAEFDSWTIDHVRRENNTRADELANAALDH